MSEVPTQPAHDEGDVVQAGQFVIIEMPSGNAKIVNLKANT
jgi:hypothetical protein